MPLPDEDLSEIRHSPTALGPASGLKCSAWAIALDRPGDCNVARRSLCDAKRRRSQERASGGATRRSALLPGPTKSLEIEALARLLYSYSERSVIPAKPLPSPPNAETLDSNATRPSVSP